MNDSTSMNIVYVIDYLFSVNGGTERQLHSLIRGMVEKGHNVRLYVLRHTEFTKNLESFVCPLESLEVDSLMTLKGIGRLWKFRNIMERDEVDVVHGFFNDVALALPILFLKSSLRVFTSRRDMGIWYTRLNLMLLRMFFWSNTRIICNCEAVADLTARMEWKRKNQISIIYNGIDRNCQNAEERDLRFLSEKIKKSDAATRVVLVANVRPVKRISDLIAAAENIARDNVHFFIIGHISDKDYFFDLLNKIDRLSLGACFHFVGPISEPRNVLKHFDVGVLCSESEGLSNTVMEYLDSGLATVISDVGGNRELVQHGVNGFLYEVGNSRQLSECILQIIDNPIIHRRFSTKSQAVISEFSVQRMVENHSRIYRNSLY